MWTGISIPYTKPHRAASTAWCEPPTKLEELRGLVSDKFLSRCNCVYLYDLERLSIKYEPFHCPYGPERQCKFGVREACQCQADLWEQFLKSGPNE